VAAWRRRPSKGFGHALTHQEPRPLLFAVTAWSRRVRTWPAGLPDRRAAWTKFSRGIPGPRVVRVPSAYCVPVRARTNSRSSTKV
jgi:hypothetical protein